MSHNRKQFDKKKLKKLAEECSWSGGSYYNERKGRYVRIWKSDLRLYRDEKKYSRRVLRRFLKKNGYTTKKVYDLFWNVW